ncbi:MAG: flagellar hook-length control protein FliK, partial [Lachnospiraceae bacterium]|nr:flagellar hook-length control protein FliK [Lachnospiraceae bacterium]
NQLMKQMLLNPADVAKDGEVEALYKRLAEQSQRAIEILKDAGQSGSEVMRSAQNINDNVNFMNQLNQMMSYVQLPIRMNQENAHGELYVYTKKKQLANKDGNVSAFLHLDMDNLGPMDVYVAMQKNKVNTNFYLADEAALDLIMEHIDILDARLQKRGYNMSTSVTMKNKNEPQKTVVGEMLKEKSNGIVTGPVTSKLSFDIRA